MTKATEHSSWAEYKKSRKKAKASSGHPISTSTQATKATGVPGTWAEYKAARQSGQIERGVQPQSSIQESIRRALNEGATSPVSSRNVGAGENILPSTRRVGAGESVRGYVGQGEYAAQMMPEDFVGPLNDRQIRRDIIRDEEYMRNAREKRSVAEELFDKFGRESINANLPEKSMPAEYTRSSAARQTAELGLPDFNQPRGQMQLMQDPYSAPVSGGIAPGQVLTQRAGITPEMTRAKQQGLRVGAGEALRMDPVEIGYENLSAQPDFAEYAAKGAQERPHTPKVDNVQGLMQQIITNPAGVRTDSVTAHMTEDELATYDYLLGKYGAEEAENYHRSIEAQTNERKGQSMNETMQNLPGWMRTGYEAAMPVIAGLDQTISGVSALGDIVTGDTRGRANSGIQTASSMISERLNENSGWNIPLTDVGWKKALYDTVSTISAQAPSIVLKLAGAPTAAMSVLDLSAFGNTYNQLRTEGASFGQALAGGLASAAIEDVTERIGGFAFGKDATLVRKLLGNNLANIANPIQRALVYTGLDATGEGLEEAIAGVAEPIVQEYILSPEEDERTFVEKLADAWNGIDWTDVRYQGVLGAASGGVMTTAPNIAQVNAEQQQKAIEGAAASIKSAETTPEQKHGAAAAALEAGGVMKEAAQEIADSVVKMANGQTVTQDELQMIAETPGALETVETIVKAQETIDDTIPEGLEGEEAEAYANRQQAIETASKLGGERRIHEEIYDLGGGNQKAVPYGMEYERAYNRGRNNMPLTDQVGRTYRTLTKEQVQAAWNAGRTRSEQLAQRKTVRVANSVTGKKGTTDTSAIDNVRLNKYQTSAVEASKFMAETLGVKVVWYASETDERGKRTSPNGWYDPKDQSIHLDIYSGSNTAGDNAGNEGMYRYATMRTFAHELTHYIEDASPAQYDQLRQMVFKHLEKNGLNVETLISEKQASGQGISRFIATQEVVADACEMMLRDSKAIENAVKENRSLWETIKERFAEFVQHLKNALGGVNATSKEALALMKDANGVLRYAEELQAKWDEALLSTRQAGKDTDVFTAESDKNSKAAEQTNREIERIEEKGGSLVLSKEKADALNKKATGKAGVTIVGDTLPTVQGRRQRAFLEALGREYGIEFVVHPTIDKGALNGVYISGNRIHLAADNLESGLMQTGIHETVHLIRAAEGEGYTELLDSVRGALGTDFDWDGTVAARAETDGLDLDAAEEEVLAEAVSAIYTNESAMRAFVMKHQSLAQRLIDGLRNFVAKMREIAERIYGRTGHEEINAMINATDEAVQKAADAYERALAEWKERAKAINYEGREPKATTPKANKSTLSTWAMALRQSAEKTGNPEVIARTEQAIANVQDFVDKAKEDSLAWKYLSSGTLNPYAPKGRSEGLGPLRTNVEYIYSFDPDTSCFRADGYIKIRDNIQRRMGRKMTARETQNLIQLMTAYGQMIPCRYCYVYGKRYMLDSAYNKKIVEKLGEGGVKTVFKAAESARRQIFEYLDEHYDVNNRYTLDEEMQVREFVLPTKRKKVRGVEKEVMMTPDDFIRDLRRHFKLESRRNLNTFLKGMVGEWLDDVFNGTSHNYDELADYVEMDTETLDIHATAVAGAQGGVKANKAKKYIPYDHQLDRIADDDMWNIIAHDGIRFQSSTDFRIEYVLDYMQLIAQMATYDKDLLVGATPVLAKNGMRTGKFVPGTGRIEHVSGLPGHMYAKNPDAAYILAPSGLHINASVAFDGDTLGQIKENTAEGMPMEDVAKLVTKYDNVGGMAMVTNPAQLAHAMKLVREGKLHQIIPFHASGLAREYYYDMMAWQDYTSVQNESLYTSSYCAEQLRKAGKEPAGTAEEIFKQYEDMFGEAEKLYVRNPKTGAYIRKAPHFLPGESVFEGVDPETGEAKVTRIPGHNNDYDTYLRLCEEWQVNPRFYEVEIPTEDGGTMKAIDDKVGYMALIYESRPGTKKAPVTADFDIEYALDQLSKRAAQDDKYAQGYLAAYEQGTDREDAIRRGQRYEKANVYDPMAIEERFFSEGLVGETRGLITPDIVEMRENAGVKLDPEKSVQLSEDAKEVYDAYWTKDTEGVRYQAREMGQISDRELLSTVTESMGRTKAERKAIYDYQMLLEPMLRKQTVADNMFRGMQKKNISREEMLTRQQRYQEILEEIDELDRQMLEMEYDEVLQGIVTRERKYISDRVEKARVKAVQEYRDRRNATEARGVMRRIITGEVKRLKNRLEKPNPEHFINDNMRKSIGELAKAFEPDGTFKKDNLADVQNAYRRMFGDGDAEEMAATGYDDRTFENLGDLRDQLDGKRLSELNMNQLRMLRESIENILHVIQNEETTFVKGRRENTAALADSIKEEMKSRGEYIERNGLEGMRDFLNNGNATPIYFFKNVGGTLERIFEDFLTGEETYAKDIREAYEKLRELKKKYNYDAWADKEGDRLTFKTTFGQEITLDRETALGLWATRQREMRDPENEVQHLKNGGFQYKEREWDNRKNKYLDKVKFGKRRSGSKTAHRLNEADNNRIAEWLTPEQRGYATEMVQYLSTDMADKGNETSRKIKGYSIFGEGFYYPYESSSVYMFESLDKIESSMLKNSGFTKKITKNASNPIIAGRFTDVWTDHVNRMSMYHAMAIPQESFWRVYNHRNTSNKDEGYQSVKAAVIGALGGGANKYIKQLMTDIYGGVTSAYGDSLAGEMMSKFKKNATAMSMSVVIQQPSSIARAFAVLPVKYFKMTKGANRKIARDEMLKYSATAFIKSIGRFDMNAGQSATEWLGRKDMSDATKKEMVKAFFSTKDDSVREEVFGFLPQWMDEWAWSQIWNAAKAETREKTEYTGEELLRATAKRFDEVIRATQVYDSVLVRSQFMRSKSAYAKMATAFMAEPTLSYNMMLDAVRNVKANPKAAKATVAAVTASTVLNSVLKSIVIAWRDKDEDKTYVEKYIGALVSDLTGDVLNTKQGPASVFIGLLGSSLLPLNNIPLVSDVLSIFQGYDVTRSDMNIVADAYEAYKTAFDENKSLYQKLYAAVKPISAITGYPISNIWRDVEGVVNLLINDKMEIIDTSARGIKYAVLESMGRAGKITAETQRMTDALIRGDMAEYEALRQHVVEDLGYTEKEADSKVRSVLRDRYESGEVSEEKAVELLEEYFGYADTKDDRDAAEREVRKWATSMETGENNQYARVWNYISDWDGRALLKEINELRKMGVEDSSIRKSVQSHFKDLYLEATGSEKSKLRQHLIAAFTYMGMTDKEAKAKIDEWDKQNRN